MLTAAYQEVIDKGTPVYKAARMHGIPISTLRDRTLGTYPVPGDNTGFLSNPGPGPTLSRIEEHQLVEHASYMASIGYTYSRKDFLNLATDFAISLKKKTNSDPPFAHSWYSKFQKRNEGITLTTKCTSQEVLDNYFQKLEKVITWHGLLDKPENIWHIDETCIVLEGKSIAVPCQKLAMSQTVTSIKERTVIIIAGGSASGTRVPPFYIFPGKTWNDSLLDGACPGSSGTIGDSGLSNSLMFMDYLKLHFLQHAPINGSSPVLVLFDGQCSHANLTMAEWGKAQNIIFYVLPPPTSHTTKPLDVGCFDSLKKEYYAECQAFLRECPSAQITMHNVARLSSNAYNKELIPDNLIPSFRKAGIYPLERKQVN